MNANKQRWMFAAGLLCVSGAQGASTLSFSSFLGGSDYDAASGVSLDAAGNIYVTGQTASTNFPSRSSGQPGNRDIFVAKLDPAGTHLIYCTILGGQQNDYPRGIAVDASGNAYVTGYTSSTDFPVTAGAYRTTASGMEDAFVLKLNPAGALIYSTYLGGSDRDFATSIAVDSSGNAYVTGYTHSTNFPTLNGFQTAYSGGFWDVFVTKIDVSGANLVFSTLLGGAGSDIASGIAIDAAGNSYVCGQTDSTNFPLARALQTSNAGATDAFVSQLNPSGSILLFSTYLGGTNSEVVNGCAVDSSQTVYLAGATSSLDLPVTFTAVQQAHAGGTYDAFISRINTVTSTLIFSTYLGGSGSDQAAGIALDAAGNAWITGSTQSPNFPALNATQFQSGGSDVFAAALNATGDTILYASYLGGTQDDAGVAVVTDSKGNVIVAGTTQSANFPTTAAALQRIAGGSYDAFVARIQTGMCAFGVNPLALNVAAPGGAGAIAIAIPPGCSAPAASSAVSWASVGVAGSNANWLVTPNPASASRSGTLTVAGETVAVAQAGTCTYSLSPAGVSFGSAGASGSIVITPSSGNCPAAQASSGVSWASVSVAGNTAAWLAGINSSSAARNAALTIGGQSFGVTQSGTACSYSLSVGSLSAGAGSASGSIGITTSPVDCSAATASSNVNWAAISVSGNSATWTVTANPGAGRSGKLTIGGQSVSVTQAAGVIPGLLNLSHLTLNFGSSGSLTTSPQTIAVNFSGSGAAWTASSSQPNVSVSPAAGQGAGTFLVSVTAGLSAVVTVTAPGAINSPQQVQVNVATTTSSAISGSFDTPISGAAGIAGAIAVTGWSLDSVEVTKVDLWREPVGAEAGGPNGLVALGDAVFVDGARPDVESANADLPLNYRAGWGYLLLTNFLPGVGGSGSGNGTYKLHAIAHSKSGVSADLGVHTIGADNAHASKPFGTIDTPGQGATISGSAYLNFGWALTQNPFAIPLDGSTITVSVDGVTLGHPINNQFRSDIATSFPGLANSGGAVGFFVLDTSKLSNGVHTIGWVVFDNQGRGDGIGSRYFNVLNSGGIAASGQQQGPSISKRPRERTPARLDIAMDELGGLELPLDASNGYTLVRGERRPLPVGSSLQGGVFYWQPGPAFFGEYRLIFERLGADDQIVTLTIRPKAYQ